MVTLFFGLAGLALAAVYKWSKIADSWEQLYSFVLNDETKTKHDLKGISSTHVIVQGVVKNETTVVIVFLLIY